jgi:hypothetical protein
MIDIGWTELDWIWAGLIIDAITGKDNHYSIFAEMAAGRWFSTP